MFYTTSSSHCMIHAVVDVINYYSGCKWCNELKPPRCEFQLEGPQIRTMTDSTLSRNGWKKMHPTSCIFIQWEIMARKNWHKCRWDLGAWRGSNVPTKKKLQVVLRNERKWHEKKLEKPLTPPYMSDMWHFIILHFMNKITFLLSSWTEIIFTTNNYYVNVVKTYCKKM